MLQYEECNVFVTKDKRCDSASCLTFLIKPVMINWINTHVGEDGNQGGLPTRAGQISPVPAVCDHAIRDATSTVALHHVTSRKNQAG
jgi:hypothetical protein